MFIIIQYTMFANNINGIINNNINNIEFNNNYGNFSNSNTNINNINNNNAQNNLYLHKKNIGYGNDQVFF